MGVLEREKMNFKYKLFLFIHKYSSFHTNGLTARVPVLARVLDLVDIRILAPEGKSTFHAVFLGISIQPTVFFVDRKSRKLEPLALDG